MDINKAIQLTLEHFQARNLKQAEYTCRKILKKQPNNIDALHFLGVICSQNGQHDLAINYIKRALQLDPNFADAYNNLGNIFQDKGQLDEAINCYRKTLQINPYLAKTYYNLGICLQDKGQLDEAIVCYQKALELNLNTFGLYNNLGLALQKKKQLDEAIECYQKALKLNPNFAEAYNNLGAVFYVKGQLDEAINLYQRAIDLNQNYSDAYCNLGISLKEKGQSDEAIICYQRAIELKPDFAWAYVNLGIVLDNKGQLDEAKIYFQKAFRCNQKANNQYDSFANMFQEKEKFHNAYCQKTHHMSILISVPVFNRKKITQLSLAQTQRYKTSYCHLQVYNDHSTEYDNSILIPYADEVIKLPHKMGIDNLRWFQFRKFLETDFDFIYMTDNDVIHDPHYISRLELLYEIGNNKLPVSLYNNIFTSRPGMILCYKNGMILKTTAPGNSMFYDREMVKRILETSDKAGKAIDHLPWDNKAAACLGLPWIISEISYLEHYGAYGINNDNYERDRAIFPTQYLRERRDSILKYLIQDVTLEINF